MAEISIVDLPELYRHERWDAEFFQPKYRRLENWLSKICALKVSDFAHLSVNSFHATNVESFQYVEISDVNTTFGETSSKQLYGNQAPDRAQYVMKGGEILVSTVRPNRSAIGLVRESDSEYVVSSGFAPLLAKNKLYRAFIFVWLKTQFMTDWLERYCTASMYPAVAVPDILKAPIFEPSDKLLLEIHDLVTSMERILRRGQEFYPEAESEMLERMNWQKLEKQTIDLFYVEHSLNFVKTKRIDAEHFQPKFKRLISHLEKAGAKNLGKFCSMPSRGVTPLYVEDGGVIIINSQNLSKTSIDFSQLEKTSKTFYDLPENRKAHIQTNDVLVYSTGAYIGRTNIYLEEKEAIAGIDIMMVRPDPKVCNPVYLGLFMNSTPGLMQSDQFASGSAQRHLYPNDLMNFSIYMPQDKNGKVDLRWQESLAEKIVSANKAKHEAEAKVETAKRLIEKNIKEMGS